MDNIDIVFNEEILEDQVQYAVIISRYQSKWVYVNHKERETWEIPGGRLEEGERPWDAACRELFEETGACDFMMLEIGNYNVKVGEKSSYGGLYFAEIKAFEPLPDMEIEKMSTFEEPPKNQTYSHIQPLLHDYCVAYLKDHVSDRLLKEPFDYKTYKSDKIVITYEGKEVMVLKGEKAIDIQDKLDKATRYGEQLLLAKVTGNFKRGNEKLFKAGR